MPVIDKIAGLLRNRSALILLIGANVLMFLLLRICAVILNLGGNAHLQQTMLQWIELPAYLPLLLHRPWTLLTYMFSQFDAWHLIFNMLMLYWIGRVFTFTASSKRLVALYISGGFAGAIVFVCASLLAPGLSQNDFLIGSSASVFAIMTAAAVSMPKLPVMLLFLGEVQLRWIVIALIAIDLCLGAGGENLGGHIAHLGGVAAGLLYPYAAEWCNCLPKRKRAKRKKVTSTSCDVRNLDEILDKIKHSGYSSLTPAERKELFEISNRIK